MRALSAQTLRVPQTESGNPTWACSLPSEPQTCSPHSHPSHVLYVNPCICVCYAAGSEQQEEDGLYGLLPHAPMEQSPDVSDTCQGRFSGCLCCLFQLPTDVPFLFSTPPPGLGPLGIQRPPPPSLEPLPPNTRSTLTSNSAIWRTIRSPQTSSLGFCLSSSQCPPVTTTPHGAALLAQHC